MEFKETNKFNKPVMRLCFPPFPRSPRAGGICSAGSSFWLKQFLLAVSTSSDMGNLGEHYWKQIIIEWESLFKVHQY